jgi:RecB family endonuclease NucS
MKEKEVINLVVEYEKRNGREAKDVRKERKGYDVISLDKNGNTRLIEVKRRNFPKERFVFLTQNEFMNFLKNENAWLYIIYQDKNKEWKIVELGREKVLKAIKPKLSIQYEVSLRKEITGI